MLLFFPARQTYLSIQLEIDTLLSELASVCQVQRGGLPDKARFEWDVDLVPGKKTTITFVNGPWDKITETIESVSPVTIRGIEVSSRGRVVLNSDLNHYWGDVERWEYRPSEDPAIWMGRRMMRL